MALISPGVQVSVIDQSNYTPAAASSVPYILLVTAQNKISGAGTGIAPGSLATNANKLYLMTSQRDLLSTFGVPFFYNTTAGTPINGYELNEYGLLAGYSALGVTNIAYVQRADIDLAALTASLNRPIGAPANGSYWLDTTNSTWGINEWNITTSAFTKKTPSVIVDTTFLETGTTVPEASYGSIGDYAITATSIYNPLYYKRGGPTTAQAPGWLQGADSADDLYNTWVLIGSGEWKTAWPTLQGTLAPSSLTPGDSFAINDTTITIAASTNNTVLYTAGLINAALNNEGVYAASIGGKLTLYADSTATNDGSTEGGGVIAINNISGTPLSTLGITAGQYAAPRYTAGPNYSAPRWRSTDTQPQPTGSVFQQTNTPNQGMLIQVKRYNSTLGVFVLQSCPVYASDADAIYALDPTSGGQTIPAGTTYAQIDPYNNNTGALQIFERLAPGATVVTGATANPTFTANSTFTLAATQPETATVAAAVTVTITGTGSSADFVAAVSAAGVENVSADVNAAGQIYFTHATGGDIYLVDGANTPLADAGFTTSVTGIRQTDVDGTGLTLSNWVGTPTFTYIASANAPNIDPADGTYWYYSCGSHPY
jgi:hypothetical protein